MFNTEMDQVEARSRFASARVARLATADRDGVPHLVPVTFDVDGDTVAFVIDHKPKKTLNLRRLRNIADNPRVSLLVDEYADDWNSLWWARADGTAEIVEAGARRDRAVGRLSERYDQYRENPPQGPAVLIAVSAWSGWAYTA